MRARRVPDDWAAITTAFGDRVRHLREKRGMSRQELADATGLSSSQLYNIETSRNNARDAAGCPAPGPTNPRLDTIWALALALGVEAEDLLRRDWSRQG